MDSTVFRQENIFAAWPAAFFAKSWGDEILVSFTTAEHENKLRGHAFNRSCDWAQCFSRSLDGGKTWTTEPSECYKPAPGHHVRNRSLLKPLDHPINFRNPDFVMTFNMSGTMGYDYSWFFVSEDRGRHWAGPYEMPEIPGLFDGGDPLRMHALNMRTSYIVLSESELLLMVNHSKRNGTEGHISCCLMKDGGRSIELLGHVRDEMPEAGHAIMPQLTQRKNGDLVCFTRVLDTRNGVHYHCCEQNVSKDGGRTWTLEGKPVEHHGGNPVAFSVLPDGTWTLVYGYRLEPYGIRMKYSEDEGKTWSPEIILRDDGGCADLGYPRTAVRADGSLVIVYYFNLGRNELRTIECTVIDKEYMKEAAANASAEDGAGKKTTDEF